MSLKIIFLGLKLQKIRHNSTIKSLEHNFINFEPKTRMFEIVFLWFKKSCFVKFTRAQSSI